MTDQVRRRSLTGSALLVAVALAAGVVALLVGGGRPEPAPAGLPDAGPLVGWALPLVKLVVDLAAVATVGLLLAAAVLLPSAKDLLGAAATRAARLAAVTGAVWSAAALALLVLTYADIIGVPLSDALDAGQLWRFAVELAQGRAWAVTAVTAAVAAVVAGRADRPHPL